MYQCNSCGNTTKEGGFTIMDSDWNRREGTGYRISCNECYMDYWVPESVAKTNNMSWYNSESTNKGEDK